jgi:hypothetical protein
MDKTFIFGFFGHFHTEVNLEIIPNLSRQAAESLKIGSFNLKIFNLKIFNFSKSRNNFSKSRKDKYFQYF